jgi:predicted MFS family arabinose efflux permease
VVGLCIARYGGRRVIACGAAVFCAGSILFVASTSLWMLYLSRALTGLGASSLYLSLEQEAHRTWKRRYPVYLALIILIGYTGGVVANAPFVLLADAFHYRTVLTWVAAITVALYLGFLLCKVSLPPLPIRPPATIHPAQFTAVLRPRSNRMLFIFGGINFGLFYVLQSVIGKKFLEDYAGLSSTPAAWALSGMGAISAAAGLSLAFLTRWSERRRVAFLRLAGWASLANFTAAALMVYFDVRSPVFAVLFFMLALTSSLSTLMLPLLRQANTDHAGDVAVSAMNFSLYFAVAVFGNLVGVLMGLFPPEPRGDLLIYGRQSYLAVFTAFAFCALLAALCAASITSSRSKTPS